VSAGLAAALVAFGVVAGAASGLLGIGGGALIVPFLVLVAGYGQHRAEAISLLVVLPTAIVGSTVLHRRGIGDLRRALALGGLGTLGGVAGARLALALPAHALQLLFAAFLAAVGLRICRRALAARDAPDRPSPARPTA
jgi:uncharacterized protein